jgi:hypothetical protein
MNMFKSKNTMMLITLLILLATAASTLLAAEGSGTAKFAVTDTLFVAGNEIKPGSYDVKWEATGSDATVRFINQGKEVAKIPAKLVDIDKKGDYNSLAVGKDSAGRDSIKGIQFAGKKVRIVFE